MDALIVLGMIGGTFALIAIVNARGGGQKQLSQSAADAGRLLHLRSAEFPATCSWCKSFTLARKLRVYERADGGWRLTDVAGRLERCPDDEVPALSVMFREDRPNWRRLCSDPCVASAISRDAVGPDEVVATCAYCGGASPAALARCTECGARR